MASGGVAVTKYTLKIYPHAYSADVFGGRAIMTTLAFSNWNCCSYFPVAICSILNSCFFIGYFWHVGVFINRVVTCIFATELQYTLMLRNVTMLLADLCEQIVKLKQIEHVIYEKRVLYSMNFPFCVRSEFTFKVTICILLCNCLQCWTCFTVTVWCRCGTQSHSCCHWM